jgi:transcription antitermination factor NusG
VAPFFNAFLRAVLYLRTPMINVLEGSWLAVYVKHNMEDRVFAGLRERNYEAFLPTYVSRRRWSDRFVSLRQPLFPGYVFCRWASLNDKRIVEIPGVIRLVGAGRQPLPIHEREIASVRRIVESGVLSMPWRLLQIGEIVRVVTGPLSGLEGTLVATDRGHRFVVSISLLQRGVAVHVRPDQLVSCRRFREISEQLPLENHS